VRIGILHTHWVLVVMDQCARRIVGFGVHRGVVDGVALCQISIERFAAKGRRLTSARTMIRCTDSTNGRRI
jgi:hypothetical protein